MNKLIYLFDIEFKRNVRNYFVIVFTFSILIVSTLIIELNKFNYIMNSVFRGKSIEGSIGKCTFENILGRSTHWVIIVGLIVCTLYSFYILNRDFSSKNKSIYTLLMTPSARYNIYVAKLLNILILSMIYLISIFTTLYISYKFFIYFMAGDIATTGFVNDTIYSLGKILPYNIYDFIFVYLVVMPAIASVIFSIVLIAKKGYKGKKILIMLLSVLLIIVVCMYIEVIAFMLESYALLAFNGLHSINHFEIKYLIIPLFSLLFTTLINFKLINGKFDI